MRYYPILFVCLTASLLIACETNNSPSFDRQPMLIQMADQIILPGYEDFLATASLLDTQVDAFAKNPTNETLAACQAAWKKAALSWKNTESFNIGPVRTRSLSSKIHYYPTPASFIETAVSNYSGSDDYIQTLGSNRKGLAAIEFLLFSSDEHETLSQFSDEKRMAILSLYTSDLVTIATRILNEWETYRADFIALSGSGTSSSASLLANQLLESLSNLNIKKLGNPMGLTDVSSSVNPDLVESPYAQESLEWIKVNLLSIAQTFNGGEGTGYDDYLDALAIDFDQNTTLSARINQQIQVCLEAANAINQPLQTAVVNDPLAVEALLAETQSLLSLMHTDMMSNIGLTVTPSDNDGD
ncbi:hypothetical protein BFP72_15155 [Reichenbachiella sp. 5M10]|uniref:imelysin family protein n=1 Tax=Reichenbachiella sp. 5M10 TaxID=1889772 RepID=UPI000C157A81|nr:imelysin family protein [Reichenbachiella sp. 5M10]PIB36642.1 hypothetical protein BFP72_15155 [Reichenbachiella sp. 5M10]